jgi:hypothetical protein
MQKTISLALYCGDNGGTPQLIQQIKSLSIEGLEVICRNTADDIPEGFIKVSGDDFNSFYKNALDKAKAKYFLCLYSIKSVDIQKLESLIYSLNTCKDDVIIYEGNRLQPIIINSAQGRKVKYTGDNCQLYIYIQLCCLINAKSITTLSLCPFTFENKSEEKHLYANLDGFDNAVEMCCKAFCAAKANLTPKIYKPSFDCLAKMTALRYTLDLCSLLNHNKTMDEITSYDAWLSNTSTFIYGGAEKHFTCGNLNALRKKHFKNIGLFISIKIKNYIK